MTNTVHPSQAGNISRQVNLG